MRNEQDQITDLDSSKVLILGSGIISRIITKRLTELEIQYNLLKADNEITYKFMGRSKGFEFDQVPIPIEGQINHWGNAHDFDFQEFWTPPHFSNLPGFPFASSELTSERQTLNSYLGLSTRQLEMDTNSATNSAFSKHLHFRAKKEIFIKNFPLDESRILQASQESIRISRFKNTSRILVEFTNPKGEKITLYPEYLIFALGGLGNLAICNHIYGDDGIRIVKNSGIGYANHPKYVTHQIELNKYVKIDSYTGTKKVYPLAEIFSVFDLNSDGNQDRNPRVSSRLWNSGIFCFQAEKSSLKRIVISYVDALFRKLGFTKYFSVMTYFESPQSTNSILEVVENTNNQIALHHNTILDSNLLDYYQEAISRLSVVFSKFPHVKIVVETPEKISNLMQIDSNHYMSTTRMSDDPTCGVVDEWGELHSLKSAFFVGTSVLPVSSANHPTYLAALLALRTTNNIGDRINRKRNNS